MPDEVYDVIVVGGGPAGLACALYAARAKLATVVLDRSPGGGSLASSSKIANYPGVKGPIPGAQLLETIRSQALEFGAVYVRALVAAADIASEIKIVYAAEGAYRARALVIATGAKGRQERIEGEEEFTGRGVNHCVTCDAAFYPGREAAVVGHDEVALEEALFLARFARVVHLVTPKSRLAGPVDLLDEVTAAPNITVHTGTRARRIVGEQFVTGLVVKDGRGDESVLAVEGVFMLLSGTSPVTDFLGEALKLSADGCIEVDGSFATSVPGVYAVGDVTCVHPKQAIIASAEGVIAALAIDRFLSGRERTKVDYM